MSTPFGVCSRVTSPTLAPLASLSSTFVSSARATPTSATTASSLIHMCPPFHGLRFTPLGDREPRRTLSSIITLGITLGRALEPELLEEAIQVAAIDAGDARQLAHVHPGLRE